MFQNTNLTPKQKRRGNGNSVTCDIITITSGKGGVGKSTISSNLAISLQKMKKKVLLIDADIHLGNLDLILGMRTQYTIADVVSEGMPLDKVIVEGPAGLHILPASSASLELLEMEDVALKKLAAAFEDFTTRYEYILVDTGAGIAPSVITFLLGADKIVLVITPDPASISDAYAVIKVIRSVNKTVPILLTANKVSTPEEGDVLYKKMNLMTQKFLKSRLIFGGSILRDDIIAQSVRRRSPFMLDYPNTTAAKAISILNRRLLQVPVVERHPDTNFFNRLVSGRKIQFEWNL